MLYLSRLILNPVSRDVRRDLADCHRLHRTVLRAFPSAPDGASPRDHFDVLHRLDIAERVPSGVALLVQSSASPDWSSLPAGYLLPGRADSVAVKRVDLQYDSITEGRILTFRLRANPTKRKFALAEGEAPRWKGKRVNLQREEDQTAWLVRKGDAGGFSLRHTQVRSDVLSVRAAPGDRVRGRKDGSALKFGSVLFEGNLEVSDPGSFGETLRNGIGSGKAYGFGLLSIAPA